MPIDGNATELREMLVNLIYNAVDALPEGRAISVKSERRGLYSVLSVSDDGIGMSEETRRRLFEPFFTTKGRASGKGLGLFTVYHIVRSHRGNLFVDSSLGEGTTLTARLPVSGAAAW